MKAHEVYSQGISKSRAKASFVICTRALNLSGPTKGKLLNTDLPIACVGGRQDPRDNGREEMLPKGAFFPSIYQGWREWGGSWMDAWIPKPPGEQANQEAEVRTTQMQKRKMKRNGGRSFCCGSPSPLRTQSQDSLPPPAPQPREPQPGSSRGAAEPGCAGHPAPARGDPTSLFPDKVSTNICGL